MKTLNELILDLEAIGDKNLTVYFGFCGCVPRGIASWRGIYAYPALGWSATGYSASGENISAPTVAELITTLRAGLKKMHEGWKGGEYWFSGSEPLHIDNPGDCNHTVIVDIEETWRVTLHTKEIDD